MMKEIISYPELGHVYPGDYFPDIPYDRYLTPDQPLPGDLPVFDIRDYGARPGDALNTAAIRAACEACRDAGGGIVRVAGGTYRSGTVRLYTGTTLWIDCGSVLMASRNAEDMIGQVEGTQDFGDESSGGAFLVAMDAQNITVTGGGVIHGQGEWFVHEPRRKPGFEPVSPVLLPARAEAAQINTLPGSIRTAYRDRIRYAEDKYGEGKPVLRRPSALVWFLRCRDVRFENIILRDSMCWTLHLEECDGITVRSVVIDDNRHVANSDGIDMSGCSRAEVEHCFISCADDGICIKNPVSTSRPSEQIHIRDCTVITVMNAFKIGTGTCHDIRDLLVEDCDFRMPDISPGSVSGISIESCDGSRVEHVTVRNIRMDRVQCPLYILLNRRNQSGVPCSDDLSSKYWGGAIRDITVEHVDARNADLPAILTGYADRTSSGAAVRKPIEKITIRDYTVQYRPAEECIRIPESFDESLTEYPECNAHGDVDACGLWIRHADGVALSGIRIAPRPGNTRAAIVLRDTEHASITDEVM